jgi:hypothetical protein
LRCDVGSHKAAEHSCRHKHVPGPAPTQAEKKRKEKKNINKGIELISKKKSQSNRDKGSAWERVGTKDKDTSQL